MRNAGVIAFWFLAAGVMALCSAQQKSDETIELTGRVTAITGTTNLQFRVDSGPIYKVLPTRDAQALFADTNLHQRVLLVKGRVHDEGPNLEVIGNLHEIRDGKVFELYYYCDICAITTSFPGLCLCCREPVVLMEKETDRRADH